MAMNLNWIAEIMDVEGAFLQDKFKNGEKIWMKIPDGMKKLYGNKSTTALRISGPVSEDKSKKLRQAEG